MVYFVFTNKLYHLNYSSVTIKVSRGGNVAIKI